MLKGTSFIYLFFFFSTQILLELDIHNHTRSQGPFVVV